MASPPNGLRKGTPVLIQLAVDSSTSDIVAGDFLAAATAGYVAQAAAGDMPVAVAHSSVASPSADGGAFVLADIGWEAIYEMDPDAGTVSQGLVGTTMDVGGPQSVNIDASTDDCLICVGVDVDRNKILVKRNPAATIYAGVV